MTSSFRHAFGRRWRQYGAIAWLAIFALLAGLFILRSGSDLSRARPLISSANPFWIMAALAAQLVTLAMIAGKYRLLFARLGVSVRATSLARIHVRRHVISSVVPFGGPAGIVSFVRDLGQYRVSASTAVYGSFLIAIVNEIAFGLFLAPVLLWLAIAGRTTGPMMVGVATLLLVLGTAIGGAIVLLRREGFRSALQNRLPARFSDSIAEALALGLKPRDLFRAVPYAFGVNLCSVAMLTFSLWAVGQHPSVTTILAARVVASITMLLIPTWQGAGAVELTVVGALVAGGVPAPAAIAATAMFRLAQFWFPMAVGAAAFVPFRPRTWGVWARSAGVAGVVSAIAVVIIVT